MEVIDLPGPDRTSLDGRIARLVPVLGPTEHRAVRRLRREQLSVKEGAPAALQILRSSRLATKVRRIDLIIGPIAHFTAKAPSFLGKLISSIADIHL